MSTFSDRIKQRMSELNILRQKDLADKAKMSTSQLSYVLSGARGLGVDALLDLASALECDPYWLYRGKTSSAEKPTNKTVNSFHVAPIVPWQMLPDWLSKKVTISESIPCPVSSSLNTFAFKVIGEAMSPQFEPGDTIFVESDNTAAQPGSFVLVYLSGNTAQAPLLRQVQQIDNRVFYAALNKELPSDMKYSEFSDSDLIAGRVIGHLKQV